MPSVCCVAIALCRYQEQRDAKSLIDFASLKYKKTIADPPVEMISQEMFESKCVGEEAKVHMCLIAVLPDILDTGAAGRNAYIEQLDKVSKAFAGAPYSYMWVTAGAQPALEANFNVGGAGYPALAAFSPKKNAFAPLKSGFSFDGIESLVKDLRKGKIGVEGIHGALAQVNSVEAWDGKDGVIQVEEEFSLDELMGDDDAAKEL